MQANIEKGSALERKVERSMAQERRKALLRLLCDMIHSPCMPVHYCGAFRAGCTLYIIPPAFRAGCTLYIIPPNFRAGCTLYIIRPAFRAGCTLYIIPPGFRAGCTLYIFAPSLRYEYAP